MASQGAKCIWLPTTRNGATYGGGHPGDVSTSLSSRLVVVESKAVEGEKKYDFGGKHKDQNKLLIRLQEVGQQIIKQQKDTSLGWIAYGLPKLKRWRSTDFRQFPVEHYLLCPHDLKGSPTEIADLPAASETCGYCRLRVQPIGLLQAAVVPPPTLDNLLQMTTAGIFGLRLDHVARYTSVLQRAIEGAELDDLNVSESEPSSEPLGWIPGFAEFGDSTLADLGLSPTFSLMA